jgi:carbonic anhydrase/acetyltransferase-like protein (isoleucine patch superfamily)
MKATADNNSTYVGRTINSDFYTQTTLDSNHIFGDTIGLNVATTIQRNTVVGRDIDIGSLSNNATTRAFTIQNSSFFGRNITANSTISGATVIGDNITINGTSTNSALIIGRDAILANVIGDVSLVNGASNPTTPGKLTLRNDGDVTISGTSANIGARGIILSTDEARKPTSGVWASTSDRRLKGNIIRANLNTCVDLVKNLELTRFEWKSDLPFQVADRNVVGWIAQDVEKYLPKAVRVSNAYGLTDCRTLDADQIYKSMYGALQWSLGRIDELTAHVKSLESLEERVKKLEQNLV